MKKIYLIFALCSAWVAGMACTNFVVGKDASVDGSTMVSFAIALLQIIQKERYAR